MKPENVKLLLQAYAQSRQDDFHGLGNLSVECDNPCWNGNHVIAECNNPYGNGNHYTGQMMHALQGGGAMSYNNVPFGGQALAAPVNVIQTGRKLAEIAKDFAAQPEKSIVRFKEILMVEEPKKQTISIPVLRDQSVSHMETKVSWKTCDKTALSGTHYTGCSGEIIFNPGDISKEIQIEILNSNDRADDLRFIVELDHGVYDPNPLTISLMKTENFYLGEKNVLKNLPSLSLPFTVPDVKSVLDSCLSPRTFLLGLTYLCSTTKDIDAQIALACELSCLCAKKSSGNAMREDSIINILTNFFSRDEYDF